MRRSSDVSMNGMIGFSWFPDSKMTRALIANRLSSFDVSAIRWKEVVDAARRLSHAEITRACDDAAKAAVLADTKAISTGVLDSRSGDEASYAPWQKQRSRPNSMSDLPHLRLEGTAAPGPYTFAGGGGGGEFRLPPGEESASACSTIKGRTPRSAE